MGGGERAVFGRNCLVGYRASSSKLHWDYAKRTAAVSSGGITATWQGKQSGMGESKI